MNQKLHFQWQRIHSKDSKLDQIKTEILARRQKFVDSMQENSAALLFAAPEATRSRDTDYPYRQDSDFWYLTQFTEPESALLLIKKAESEHFRTILFNRIKDPLAETWTGYRLGQEAALSTLWVDEAHPFDDIAQYLPQYISGLSVLYYADQQYAYADNIVDKLMQTLRQGLRQQLIAPRCIIDWRPTLHEMRLFKSPYEINILRKACHISALGHIKAMTRCKPDRYEYQLEADILHEFAMHGARFPSYNTIVGSGNNGCILHYEKNSDLLSDGELVLIDAGCEYQYYAGDITRTFPINGQFTSPQRDIYDIVLSAQITALTLLKPGTSIKVVNDEVIKIMVSGLVNLGILKGNVDNLIAEQAYLPFYMHGLGHWLGIDVHDVGDYKTIGRDRILEPGMVLTVEPGLYINHEADVATQYKSIGIRIEDNIVITKTGNEVLTSLVPKEPKAIEQLMANK